MAARALSAVGYDAVLLFLIPTRFVGRRTPTLAEVEMEAEAKRRVGKKFEEVKWRYDQE